MEALPVALLAFLVLCMVVPFAFGIECYSCTNQPFISGGATCGSGKAQKITCAPLVFNRCMTMKYTQYLGQLAGSTLVELRNCSNIPSCDPDSQYNICKVLNLTGMLIDCSLDCCEGDLCNKAPESKSEVPESKSEAFGLVASLGAIFFVFVLNMFA